MLKSTARIRDSGGNYSENRKHPFILIMIIIILFRFTYDHAWRREFFYARFCYYNKGICCLSFDSIFFFWLNFFLQIEATHWLWIMLLDNGKLRKKQEEKLKIAMHSSSTFLSQAVTRVSHDRAAGSIGFLRILGGW